MIKRIVDKNSGYGADYIFRNYRNILLTYNAFNWALQSGAFRDEIEVLHRCIAVSNVCW